MQSFKQYLKEETSYPWQATTNKDLLKLPGWRKGEEPGRVVFIEPDTGELYIEGLFDGNGYFNTVNSWPSIANSMLVKHGNGVYLPFKLKYWKSPSTGNKLSIEKSTLTSFIGFPNKINGVLFIADCFNLTVEGCPKIIGDTFVWPDMPITNNFDKVITSVEGTLNIPVHYRGFLSFLKMDKIGSLRAIQDITHTTRDFVKASEIVASHLKTKDILACQEELIEAGLKEYAKF